MEVGHERGEEPLVIQQPIDLGQLLGQLEQLRWDDRVPQRRLIVPSSQHPALHRHPTR
jgi:hypothetical protein